MQSYRLARMSPGICALTIVLLVLPAALLVSVLAGHKELAGPFVMVSVIYCWVWLRFRPSLFIIRPDVLEVVWPLKRRQVPRQSILNVRLVNAQMLKAQIGWGARVGAGGLWGGFGWLWTKRRGIVQMYISRTDQFVWIDCGDKRSWLITPERSEEFIREMSQTGTTVAQQSSAGDVQKAAPQK